MSGLLKDHPLSEIFPLVTGREFKELVDDIKENGLREPIVVIGNEILDGRNRYRACKQAGVEVRTAVFDIADDPLKFIISKNIRRRQLKQGQRAYIAAELATRKLGDNRFNHENAPSASEAAQLMSVSLATVKRAIDVRKNGIADLKAALQAGEVSVLVASMLSKLTADEQRQKLKQGKSGVVATARKARGQAGRHGRSEYSILWKGVDEICDALEKSRIDLGHMATRRLEKEFARVAKSRRKPR